MATFALATLGIGATPALAELDIDIFGGVSWTKSTDVAVDGIDNTNVSVKGVFKDVDMDPGYTVGLRLGYWFEFAPWLGLGLDGFYFSLPVPAQTVDSTVNVTGKIFGHPISSSNSGQVRLPSFQLPSAGFSPQLMLRWPLLTSNDLPKGRNQPRAVRGVSLSFFPDFELRDKSGLHFTTDLDTHNVVGGISIRF